MNIQHILNSVPTNPHFAARYMRFITRCISRNFDLPLSTPVEKHHILPKAVFPEYGQFSIFPLNCALLTPRQHFIAHQILTKVFTSDDHEYSMCYAFQKMYEFSDKSRKSHAYSSAKEMHIKRMKYNNPMRDPETKAKAVKAMAAYYTEEKRKELSESRMGVNNITPDGIRRLREYNLGKKRTKTAAQIANHKKSMSTGVWKTPWGNFYSPQSASDSPLNVNKLSRHMIDKKCKLPQEVGFTFIKKSDIDNWSNPELLTEI